MVTSRLIILGVAVAAAGGAGYVAKNMVATPPPQVIVESGPQAPAIACGRAGAGRRCADGHPLDKQHQLGVVADRRRSTPISSPASGARSGREAEGFDRPRRALYRRTAAPLQADRRGPELHVVDLALRQASGRDADIGRHLGRRLHPAERLCRRDHDPPLANRDAAATASSPRRSSRTSACSPSTRPSRKTRKARRSRSARPRRWN